MYSIPPIMSFILSIALLRNPSIVAYGSPIKGSLMSKGSRFVLLGFRNKFLEEFQLVQNILDALLFLLNLYLNVFDKVQ